MRVSRVELSSDGAELETRRTHKSGKALWNDRHLSEKKGWDFAMAEIFLLIHRTNEKLPCASSGLGRKYVCKLGRKQHFHVIKMCHTHACIMRAVRFALHAMSSLRGSDDAKKSCMYLPACFESGALRVTCCLSQQKRIFSSSSRKSV